MGLFDLFKSNPVDYFGEGVTFRILVSNDVYNACLVNDYVKLWTGENLNEVRIYAPDEPERIICNATVDYSDKSIPPFRGKEPQIPSII